MTRKRDKSELDHVKGELRSAQKTIREQEKEIRQLQKQLTFHQKRHHLAEVPQDDDVVRDSEDTPPKLLMKDCDGCGKGKLIESIEIMGKVYGNCSNCKQSGRIK